jgi:hypothetical protein
MPKHLPSTLGIIALFVASTALGAERSELEKSTVKAATDCVAEAALNNPNITTLYRQNRLKEVTDWIVLKSNACDNPLRSMRLLHDRIYGEGTGREFERGDYLADLPRAVRVRIGDEVEKRIASESRNDPLRSYATPFARSGPSFRPKKPEPLAKYTALECVPIETVHTDRRDPIYKIIVTISFDGDWQPEDMTVSHYAASGTSYNRAEQYTRSNLAHTPGKADYYWTGTWIKNSAVTMKGHLIRTTDNKWTYSEQTFKYGRQDYGMSSICHTVEPE